MKPISSITKFLCSSSRRLFTRTMPLALFTSESKTLAGISHFSTSSPDSPFSSSNHSSARPNSDDIRNVRVSVSVWWDFDNRSVPRAGDRLKIIQRITAAVRANGFMGPIEISAFGDVFQLPGSIDEELRSKGINFYHIHYGRNNKAYTSLLFDLMYWVSKNRPTAHIFLISGNKDFASILHRLRMNNYNILLASPDNAPAVLCSAACILWQWTWFVKGECLQSEGFDLNSETKVVPVMDYKENVGQNASREEKASSPSKLNVPKLSTNSEEPLEKQEEPQKVQEQPYVIEKAKEGELGLDQLHPIEMREAIPEVGILKKIWRKWFRGDDDYQEKIFH